MALKKASVFARKSKSGKGLTLSGDDLDDMYTTAISQVEKLLNGDREFVSWSRVVPDPVTDESDNVNQTITDG